MYDNRYIEQKGSERLSLESYLCYLSHKRRPLLNCLLQRHPQVDYANMALLPTDE